MNYFFQFSSSDWEKIQPYLKSERLWPLAVAFAFGLIIVVFFFNYFLKNLTLNYNWRNFKLSGLILWLWLLILLYRVGWAIFLPLHIDEVFNYVFLVSRGFWVSWAFYPGPNNHVFYTLFSTLWFFLPAKPALRIGSLLFSTVYSWFLALYLQRKYNKNAAAFGLLLTASGEYFTLYSAMGRGYALQNLLVFLAIVACLGKINKMKLLIYALSNFFGLFTLPTHLFFFFPIAFFSFFKIDLKNFIVIHFYIFAFTLLAYLPILTFNSELFLNNEWINNKPFNNYFEYWVDSIGVYYHYEWLGFGVSVLILRLTMYRIRENELFKIFVFIAIADFILCLLIDRQPFNRTWFWRMSIEFSILAIFLSKWPKIAWILISIYFLANFFYLRNKYFFSYSIYNDVELAVERIYEAKPAHVYAEVDIYQVFLRLKYLESKTELPRIDVVFDELADYDFLILKKGHKFAKCKLLFENKEVEILKVCK